MKIIGKFTDALVTENYWKTSNLYLQLWKCTNHRKGKSQDRQEYRKPLNGSKLEYVMNFRIGVTQTVVQGT